MADATVVVAGPLGTKKLSIHEVFQNELLLEKGEFIVQFMLESDYVNLPFAHVKRTKQDKIDYPLITAVAIQQANRISIAFSGVCQFPFRSSKLEDALNQPNQPLFTRIDNAIGNLPAAILTDLSGSADYREFVLKNIMAVILERLEGTENVSITG